MAASRHDNHGSRPPGGFLRRVADLYAGGFREMTVGRTLWAVLLIKLAIMFLVFKLFFFPDWLARDYDTDDERARAVRTALTDRQGDGDTDNESTLNDNNLNLLPDE